ncbi:uncharacterized protein LOC124496238 [Dermatophagoides farinae]|uniref:uncharacterized protein LOC124496238 n=1 Tax=Dermatophagoides farinae TaxID=6954 RepID=UPI003F6421C7
MVVTRAGTEYGDDINPEMLRNEVKDLVKRIRINNISIFHQGVKAAIKTGKVLYDEYYKYSKLIIEDGNFTSEEEKPFDEMKSMVDLAFKYAQRMDVIERNSERNDLTKFERQLTEDKCNEISRIAEQYPCIADHVINVVNRFHELNVTKNRTKTIETNPSREGATQNNQSYDTIDVTPPDATPILMPQPSTSSNDNNQPLYTIYHHQKQSTSNSESEQQKQSSSNDSKNQQPPNAPYVNNPQPSSSSYNSYQHPNVPYYHNDQYYYYNDQAFWWDYNQYQTNWSGGAKVAAKKLEKFNGDPLAYHTFRKTIQHYVVDNPQIRGNANKIMEIIDLLPHKDRYIIECFNPNTCTMVSIMAELDEHYASPNRIIPALVDRLRKAPFLSLRPLERDWEALVEITILIRKTLLSANLASEERSLVGVLLQKIDRAHFMHIGDKRAITLEQILQYFKTGLDRERTAISQIASSDLNVRSTQRPNTFANRTTNNVMMTTSTNTCMFADGNHKTEDCQLTIQERRQIAIDKRMCFRCGGFRHNSKDCDRRFKCDVCNKNHITYLCNDLKPKSFPPTTTINEIESTNNASNDQTVPKQIAESSTSNVNQSSKQSITNNLLTQNSTSLYKTTMATVNGRNVRVLFDDGSGSSFISQRLAELWKLRTDEVEPICMETLSQATPTITGSKVVSLSIPICNGTNEHLKFRINDKINTLRFDCVTHEQQLLIRQQNIPFYDEPRMVDLLIGLDNINKIQLEDEKRLSNDLVAKRTTLGWTVFGSSRNLNVLLPSYKNIGNEVDPEHNVDKESKLIMNKVMTNYCKTEDVKYDDSSKQYSIKVPFIINEKIDPNVNGIKEVMNHMLMQMNVDRRKQYRSMMNDMETKEVIEPTKIAPNISYRIPHFVISRDDEKQPWNKAIFKEIILWDIVRPLLKFCMKPIGIINDIQSVFYNIEIDKEHRDYVQFLWLNLEDNSMCYRFIRRPFRISSSPFVTIEIAVNVSDDEIISLIYGKSKLIQRKIVIGELIALSYGAIRAKSIEGMIRPKHLILYYNVTNNVKRSERNINQFQCPVAVRLYTIKSKVTDIDLERKCYNEWLQQIDVPPDPWKRSINEEMSNRIPMLMTKIMFRIKSMNDRCRQWRTMPVSVNIDNWLSWKSPKNGGGMLKKYRSIGGDN